MQVRDLKKLRSLIVIQELSHREIAEAAGWRSHTYVSRLLRGEVKTLKAEPAIAIAKLLGAPLEDLFVTRMSDYSGHIGREYRTGRRSA